MEIAASGPRPSTFEIIERRSAVDDGIAALATFSSSLVSVLDRATGGEASAFLDVETTGLGLTAGTLVILVGLGHLDEHGFTVRQFFLSDPGGERAMLEAIADYLGRFDRIFTFNGKRFDAPMLVSRYRMHRLHPPLPSRHVDLLHPARQIWRRRLGRGNLTTLEARVLGIVRESDVPGDDIPPRYYAYLREENRGLIEPVLDHNWQDIVSLARLAGVMGRLLGDHAADRQTTPSDLLGVGRLLEAAGHGDRARRCYESALVGAASGERAEALYRLASLARKANDTDRAIQLFDALSRHTSDRAATAAIELAKLYEHEIRRPEQALVYAKRALLLPGLAPSDDLDRRIVRLERKISRRAARARRD